MSRTLTAMFDSRTDAEAARDSLIAASIDADDIQIHDRTSTGYSETGYSTHENRGFWASLRDMFLPDEDRYTYEEGVRRGAVVLTAEVDEEDVDEAESILDAASSVDVDERAAEWRSSGWTHPAPVTAGTTATLGAATTPAVGWDSGSEAGGTPANSLDTDADRRAAYVAERSTVDERGGDAVDEERIPIVEEQIRVGKRDVDRGGVRVRSYVVEEPVHDEVSLRNERVSVERRAVDLPLSAADDAFRERTIEMTERGEEAVVSKEARVREELVVKKDVDESVKRVDDTVRRTEVEVENTGRDRDGTVPVTPTRRI